MTTTISTDAGDASGFCEISQLPFYTINSYFANFRQFGYSHIGVIFHRSKNFLCSFLCSLLTTYSVCNLCIE